MNRNLIKISLLIFLILCSRYSISQQNFPAVVVQYDSADAWTFENLQLIPVRYVGDGGSRGYLPYENVTGLQKALRTKKVRVNELKGSGNADVRVLEMRNMSKEAVVIHSGEILLGGKQDRIVAETIILPPDKETYYVNVYCVEKGRWDKKARPFHYFRSADMGLRRATDVSKKQHHIWENIQGQFTASGKKSETAAYREILRDRRFLEADSQYVKWFTAKLATTDSNFAGFIAITGGQIIGTDLYATRDLTMEAFQNTLRSYAATAIVVGDQPDIEREKVINFMTPILSDNKTRNDFLRNRGRVFSYRGKIIHIVAYGD